MLPLGNTSTNIRLYLYVKLVFIILVRTTKYHLSTVLNLYGSTSLLGIISVGWNIGMSTLIILVIYKSSLVEKFFIASLFNVFNLIPVLYPCGRTLPNQNKDSFPTNSIISL